MFWELSSAETTPIKGDDDKKDTEVDNSATVTDDPATSTPAPEVAPEPADGGFFTDPAKFWSGVGESIQKSAEDMGKQNEENMNNFRTEWGRNVAAMNDGALNLGRIMFEDVEDKVEDLVFEEQVKTMNAATEELKEFILSDPFSVKVQGFLCAVVVFLTSLLSTIVNLLNANVFVAVLYVLFMGWALLFIIIEYKPMLVPSRVGNFLREEARFIFKPFGRPMILHIASIFIFSQSSFSTLMGVETALAGLISFAMTIYIFYLSHNVSHELHAIKFLDIDYADLSKKFNEADTMMKGKLDTHEFVAFMHSIKKDSEDLSYDDIQNALQELDENHDGEISWDEFIAWYEVKEDYLI